MKTSISFTGRTGRTMIVHICFKHVHKIVVVYPDGRSEVQIVKTTQI